MPVVGLEEIAVTASDDAALAVQSSGGGGATVVVLLHGFTLDHRSWSAVISRLLDAGASVVAIDLRGHGRSELGATRPDLSRLREDVFDVLKQLTVTDAVVIGHSLGAFVALDVRADPRVASHVRGVVAISGMTTSIRNPFVKAAARAFGSRVGARMVGHPRLGRSMLRTWFRKDAPESEIEPVRRSSAECPPSGRSAVGKATAQIDLRAGLTQPGPPTLVVCGVGDRATPMRHSREIADAIERAELLSIPDAGHMVITEQPATVAAAVLHSMGTLDDL